MTEALTRGSRDNVTCVVAVLHTEGGTAERVYHRGSLKYGTARVVGAGREGGSRGYEKRVGLDLSADEVRDCVY